MRIPAKCWDCGYVFASGFAAGVGVRIGFEGCVNSCPRCNGTGQVVSGFMEILDEAILFISGPEITKEIFEAIGIAVRDVRSGKATIASATVELATISPQASQNFFNWANLGSSVLGLVWAIASTIYLYNAPPGANRSANDEAEAAAEQYYRDEAVRQSPAEQVYGHWKPGISGDQEQPNARPVQHMEKRSRPRKRPLFRP